MKANVEIIVRERGKIVQRHEGHNVWVDLGEEYLAELISLTSHDPDVPERSDRVKYMGFGIGGAEQTMLSTVNSPPFSTSYPAGSDPNATTGNEYRDSVPVQPPITTLERPVRISGGTTAYPGAGSDVWLVGPPSDAFFSHPSPGKFKMTAFVSGTSGDIVYSPFDATGVPISEAGLFTSAATTPGEPFNTLVAYHSFGTILLTTTTDIDFLWTVSF